MSAGASSTSANRISVALCTYNGEAFLPQQLASIESQTRLPDEVVICDDRSSDRTIDIVKRFAASAPFPVKVILNRENLGSTKNFEQAIRACSGDFIALSDQDDMWYPIRLERSEQELLAHPEVGLIFSEGSIVDDEGRLLRKTMWTTFGFTGQMKSRLLARNYDLCLKNRFVTGATVMFRANLRDRCLPVGPGWLHDEWIAAAIAIFGDLRPVDEPLIFYRLHDFQQLGPNAGSAAWKRRKKLWTARLNALSNHEGAKKQWNMLLMQVRAVEALCDFLSGMPLNEQGYSRLSSYRSYLQFLFFRSNLPPRRLARLYRIVGSLPMYMGHARWGEAAKDLLISRP